MKRTMNYNPELLRINIGFIIHESVGYSRDFNFSADELHFNPDFDIKKFSGETRFSKTAQGILVEGEFEAFTILQCSRCLEPYLQKIHAVFTDLYAFTLDSVDESGLLVPESGVIDLNEVVREELILSVPISPLCRIDCKGLCPVCGANRNYVECNHQEEKIDPRLSILKTLLEEKD